MSYVITGTWTEGPLTLNEYSFRCDRIDCCQTKTIADTAVIYAARKLPLGGWVHFPDGTRELGGLTFCPRHASQEDPPAKPTEWHEGTGGNGTLRMG